MANYKPGDKARVVKKPVNFLDGHHGWVDSMDRFKGEIVTIAENLREHSYIIEEDNRFWHWDDRWFEPVVDKEKPEEKQLKPSKRELTLLKKTIEAVDEMLRLISKSEDFQKSGEIFYHLIREVEGSPRHPDISYFIDGYPRLKHDDTWRIVVKLFQGEYGNTKELKKDLENLKRKIKQKTKD